MVEEIPQPNFSTCPTCDKTKPVAEFGRDRRRAEHCIDECIACQDVCRANRDAARARRLHDRRQCYRHKVLAHYGEACSCCGSVQMLAIDHVGGDGARHREEVNAPLLYRWLVENGFPAGFQTLCRLCNSSKGATPACRLKHGGSLADPAADWWLIDDVATHLGIKVVSAKSLRGRSRLPPGDRMLGPTPVWRPATITAWKRPGRGARTDLDRG
jgi:hypothetical protein